MRLEVEVLLHICLNRTRTGQSDLRMINSPHGVFDPELEQHKYAEEARTKTKIV